MSKTFTIRVNKNDSDEIIENKIVGMKGKISIYQSSGENAVKVVAMDIVNHYLIKFIPNDQKLERQMIKELEKKGIEIEFFDEYNVKIKKKYKNKLIEHFNIENIKLL